MRHIIQWFKQIKVKAIILLPFYLFTYLPLHAQVGTWQNHLAYHDVQNICATDQYLFVLGQVILPCTNLRPCRANG